jgi:hypothetical protein
MSLERRLREGVDRLTADVDPDVERHLHTSLRSGRRRILVRRAGSAAGALAVAALAVITVPRVLDSVTDGARPGVQPSPSSTITTASVAGTYTLTVDPGPSVVDELGLAGAWTFELRADGTMTITPPPGLAVATDGHNFRIREGVFETNAFVNDLCNEAQGANQVLGTYRIERVGDDLILDAQADACLARVEILDDTILRVAE